MSEDCIICASGLTWHAVEVRAKQLARAALDALPDDKHDELVAPGLDENGGMGLAIWFPDEFPGIAVIHIGKGIVWAGAVEELLPGTTAALN